MRREHVKHKKIDLEILIIKDVKTDITRLEYFSINSGHVKEIIDKDKVVVRVLEIEKERYNLCIWDNGKKIYPMRKRNRKGCQPKWEI